MDKLEKTELILLVIYKNQKVTRGKLNRRDISTIYYVINKFVGKNDEGTLEIYPDGLELSNVNSAIDYLILKGIISSEKGNIRLTELGEKIAKEIDKESDENLRELLTEVLSLPKNIRRDLALVLRSDQYVDHVTKEVLDASRKLLSKFRHTISTTEKAIYKGY
ncbi:MAG: hypothetical protein ACP6IP_08150 [Candidatus Njordarchaeia archaeon]